MAQYYYFNESGEKVGPIRGRDIQALAAEGGISPETVVELPDGTSFPARKVKGLTFATTPPPPVPPPVSPQSPPSDGYFYLDANKQKQGPVNIQQLQTLVNQGIITQTTLLAMASGHKGLAGRIKSLNFPVSVPPPVPAPVLSEPPPEQPATEAAFIETLLLIVCGTALAVFCVLKLLGLSWTVFLPAVIISGSALAIVLFRKKENERKAREAQEENELKYRISQGDTQAQYELGGKYLNRKNTREAVQLLKQAAEKGHEGAQYAMGRQYKEGNGVVKNPDMALYWFGKAAKQGHSVAQREMDKLTEPEPVPVPREVPVPTTISASKPYVGTTDIAPHTRPTRANSSSDPLIVLNGTDSTLYVYEGKVVISRNTVLALFTHGIKGDKTLYFSKITSLQFQPCAYLQFSLPGGNESRGGLLAAFGDENTLFFGAKQNDRAKAIHDFIEDRIMGNSTPADHFFSRYS